MKNSSRFRRVLRLPIRKTTRFGLRLFIKLVRKSGFLRFAQRVGKRYKNIIHARMYSAWAADNEQECFEQYTEIATQPKVSIVVPAYNTPTQHLLEMVYSVVNQHYENWELLLVNASDDPSLREELEKCADIDTRIKTVKVRENLGIAGNTNAGIDVASGDYIAFLDHDDVLHPCALHSVVSKIVNEKAEVVYTDEDKISHDGSLYFAPHCKPKWSPDLLRNVNYINHLCVIKTDQVRRVNGLRQEFDGAQDYDLLLRVIDLCHPKIEHSPHVLYHWRAVESSTASNIANKQYVLKAGERALQEHLDRNKQNATAEALTQRPGFYKVTHKSTPSVSVVIGPVSPRFRRACAAWLADLLVTAPKNEVELIIGDWYDDHKLPRKGIKLKTVEHSNFWVKTAKLVSNEVVVCFQAAISPGKHSDLWQLTAVAAQDSCATASPIIINKEQTVLDAGLVESDFGLQPLFMGHRLSDSTPFGSVEWNRDVAAPSLAAFATKKDNFLKIINSQNGGSEYFLHPNLMPELKGYHVIWSHNPFTYKGALYYPDDSNYFNPQLHLAQSLIHMRSSSWEKLHERAEDE